MQPKSIIVENNKKKTHLKLKNPWEKMQWSNSGHEDTAAINEMWCARENGWWGDGFPWVREMKRKGERRKVNEIKREGEEGVAGRSGAGGGVASVVPAVGRKEKNGYGKRMGEKERKRVLNPKIA